MKIRHYRFNPRKLIQNIVVPMQFTAGLLLIFGAAGSSEIGETNELKCIVFGIIGILLMWSTAIYQKIKRKDRRTNEINWNRKKGRHIRQDRYSCRTSERIWY